MIDDREPERPATMAPTVRHRLLNLFQSVLLIGGMAGIAWACASVLWGGTTALWVFVGLAGALLLAPALPADFVLSLYRARRIRAADFPQGVALVQGLARKADLEHAPAFFYLPSTMPNAFATGRGRGTAIAVSDGLLRLLDERELAGVIAHEISHIAHGDLWIMGLADAMARITAVTSLVGQFLLLINLPLIVAGEVHVPWIVPLLLAFSPTIMSLLQLALSRAREFDADLGAVRLTGDPVGLASALVKLERSAGRFWEEILLPGRRMPDPSLLRTHPKTEDRIARLTMLDPDAFRRQSAARRGRLVPAWPQVVAPPRWRRTGVWY